MTVSTEDYAFETSNEIYNYTFCINCSLYFLENRPISSELNKIYPPGYSGWNKRSKFMQHMRRSNFQSKLLKTLPPRLANVLDYGCGNGEFISSVSHISASLTGFDFTIAQVPRELRNESKMEFTTHHDTLRQRAPFDRIFLLQVIEHLPEPIETLIFLSTLLGTDGKIIIETPSRSGWDSMMTPYKFWGGWHAPRHFHIWDDASLAKLSSLAGLKVTKISYLPSPYQWAETLKPRVPKALKPYITSDKVVFVGIFYILDLFQIMLTKKSSNLRVILEKN